MANVTVPKEAYDTLLNKFVEVVKEHSDNTVNLLKRIDALEEKCEAQEEILSVLERKLKFQEKK